MNDLLDIWDADAFRLRWLMARSTVVVNGQAPLFNTAISRITGLRGSDNRLRVDYRGIVGRADHYRIRTNVRPANRRTLYEGSRANVETIFGVYLWWLTTKGIICHRNRKASAFQMLLWT